MDYVIKAHPTLYLGVTEWEMAHGAGSGMETITNWVSNADALWAEAGNKVQWRPT